MGWLEALVLGIVQGLTEFLPISSSAHQSIVGQFFGGQDPGSAFTAITQLGTESAVIIFFKDIWLIIELGAGIDRQATARRSRGQVGLAGDHRLDSDRGARAGVPGRNRSWAAEPLDDCRDARRLRHHHRGDRPVALNARPLESLTWRHGLFLGLVQSLALVPAFPDQVRPSPAGWRSLPTGGGRLPFLLAIPAVVGSGLFKLADISSDPVPPAWGPIALATVISFVIGYAVIAWLLRYVSTHTFMPFVIYRCAWPRSWSSC